MAKPKQKFEFTDRYKALGIPYPDPKTMCKGQCEGIGYFPTEENGKWKFIKCPDCNGTGQNQDYIEKLIEEYEKGKINDQT